MSFRLLLWPRPIHHRQKVRIDIVPADIYGAVKFHQSTAVHIDRFDLAGLLSKTPQLRNTFGYNDPLIGQLSLQSFCSFDRHRRPTFLLLTL